MRSPIVTVTLNPAIDLTVTLDELTPGEVVRARTAQSNVGGKGINVAGCLVDWGEDVIATGVLGRVNDSAFVDFFAAKGIRDRFVRAAGETRTNIKISDLATGDTTDINLPGISVDTASHDDVFLTLVELVKPGTIVVLAGSLPTSLPDETWAVLTRDLHHLKARVVLDTSGAPLAAALDAGPEPLPYAVKPNRQELESWVGRPLVDTADIVGAARRLVERGIRLVVVSLGPEGAIFVRDGVALAARLPPLQALSTVGAGDAMVAGLVTGITDDLGIEDLARRSVAFAAGKLGRVGPHLPSRDEVLALAAKAEVRVLRL